MKYSRPPTKYTKDFGEDDEIRRKTRSESWKFLCFMVGVAFSITLVIMSSSTTNFEQIDTVDSPPLLNPRGRSGLLFQNYPETGADPFYSRGPPLLIATTRQGDVRGILEESRAGRNYVAFFGVPYAKPPLRFQMAEPPEPWEGVREANRQRPQCIQKEKYAPVLRATGEEDCLYLNIYTPKLPAPLPASPEAEIVSPNYPVMFYVHGGGYTSGNGSRYGADYFMDEDCIIITMEFRLGVFGFLSTEDMVVPGNLAYKDIIMALRWVQENVAAFGGDPSRVTVFGNSSGAMMVHALLLSQMSIGLFHRAISQSGVAIVQGSVVPSPKIFASGLGRAFNCSQPESSVDLVECLRQVDAEDLATYELAFFGPCVEPTPEDGNLTNIFLSASPYELMQRPVHDYPMKVPWIVGDNSGEELGVTLDTLTDIELIDKLNENWAETIKSEIVFRHTPSTEKLDAIKKFYFPTFLGQIGNETKWQLLNLYSDTKFNHGTKLAALAHARHSPVFLYWLTKEPAKSYAEKSKANFPPSFLPAVAHADELQYFFLYDYPEIPIGSPYTRFSQKLVKNWAHFAATGTPAIVNWTAIDPADNGTVWFTLDEEVGMTRSLRWRMNFWDPYVYELYGWRENESMDQSGRTVDDDEDDRWRAKEKDKEGDEKEPKVDEENGSKIFFFRQSSQIDFQANFSSHFP